MCGLVGVLSRHRNGFTSRQVEIFNTLLYVDALRGEDSTGAFMVTNTGNVEIVKEAHSSYSTIASKEYKMLTGRAIMNGWAMVGHNRKATKGNITDENAHPFWVDEKLVLVHNGTMWGDHKQHADVEVDSHAIAHLIAEESTLEQALGKFNAAYALIWYNVETKTLNFLRNSQRPLHFMETESELIWASEGEMLDFVRQRMTLVPKKNEKIYQLKEMTLLSETLGKTAETIENIREIRPVYAPAKEEVSRRAHPFQRAADVDLCGYGESEWYNYDAWGEKAVALGDANETILAQPVKEPAQNDATTEIIAKTHTMTQYEQIKGSYDNKKIMVESTDYSTIDENSDIVFMIGRTMDKHRVFVIFPINKKMADAVTDPKNPRNRENKPAIFKLDVDVVSWKRKSSEPAALDPDVTPGYMSIKGKNAVLTHDGAYAVQ